MLTGLDLVVKFSTYQKASSDYCQPVLTKEACIWRIRGNVDSDPGITSQFKPKRQVYVGICVVYF